MFVKIPIIHWLFEPPYYILSTACEMNHLIRYYITSGKFIENDENLKYFSFHVK